MAFSKLGLGKNGCDSGKTQRVDLVDPDRGNGLVEHQLDFGT